MVMAYYNNGFDAVLAQQGSRTQKERRGQLSPRRIESDTDIETT